MSTVLILTPIIISNWPAITAAVVGAASALGFVTKKTIEEEVQAHSGQKSTQEVQSVEVELADSEILTKEMAKEHQIVLQKGTMEIIIKRDERGRCVVHARGKGHSRAELKQAARQFTEKLTQCFMYDKVVKQLKNNNFQIVNEEVGQNEDIRIHVRRWVD